MLSKKKKPISRCYMLYDYLAFSRDKFIVKKKSEVPRGDSGGRCEDKGVVRGKSCLHNGTVQYPNDGSSYINLYM